MDADRFDALLRSLFGRTSRRGVLASLASGLLAVLPLTLGGNDAQARKKRKKKKKCKSGTKKCGKECAPLCTGTQASNPITCRCCQSNGESCSPAGANAGCCSGSCEPVSTGFNACAGRGAAEPCEFDAQCATGACGLAGLCFFAAP